MLIYGKKKCERHCDMEFYAGIFLGIVIGFMLSLLVRKSEYKGPLPSALCQTMHDEAARVSASSALPFDTIHTHLMNCMVHGLYCPLKNGNKHDA